MNVEPKADTLDRMQGSGPLVSVLILDSEERTSDRLVSLRSLLNQTMRRWRTVILTSHSLTADERALLKGRASDICVIKTDAPVIPASIQLAAPSPYVMPLRAGDHLEETALEKLVLSLYYQSGMAFAGALDFESGIPQLIHRKEFKERNIPPQDNFCFSGTLWRTEHAIDLDRTELQSTNAMQHLQRLDTLLEAGKYGWIIPEYLLHRTIRPQSINSSRSGYPRHRLQINTFQPSSGAEQPQLSGEVIRRLGERYAELSDSIVISCAEKSYSKQSAPLIRNQLDRPDGEKRILMFVCPLEISGSTKFNLDMVEELTSRGWKVTIAVAEGIDQQWMPRFLEYTKDIFIMPRYCDPFDHVACSSYLIESRQPDAVFISHSRFGYDLLGILKSNYADIPIVDYIHVERESFGEGGFAAISVFWQQVIDLTITSSNQLRQWMLDNGHSGDRIEVAYTNIDARKVAPDDGLRSYVRRTLGLNDTVPVLLFAGRLSEQKQPQVMVEVARQLRNRGFDFRLLIAGDGGFKETIIDFIGREKLEQVVWYLGRFSNSEVLRLMQAADIFFLPSRWEGISLAIFEAMALRTVVVSAAVGGQRELVTEEVGFLVEPSSPAQEVSQYVEILSQLLGDGTRRQAMAQAARVRIEQHFRLEQMGDRLHELLTKVIERESAQKTKLSQSELQEYCELLFNHQRSGWIGWKSSQVAHRKGIQLKSLVGQKKLLEQQALLAIEELRNRASATQFKPSA